MAVRLDPVIFSKFLGIREFNGVNYDGVISAITAKNVEFYQTEIGSGTGIRTTKGNAVLYTLPEGFEVVDNYSSTQDRVEYEFIYAENETLESGALFYLDHIGNVTPLVENLPLSGKSSGLTMKSTAYDVFIFSNWEQQWAISLTHEESSERIKQINAVDRLGRKINWLAMDEWNGYLVVASQYGVHASHQNDVFVWDDNPLGIADSWYIDFSQEVTGIVGFKAGVFIFTQKELMRLIGSPNDVVNSALENVAVNGNLNHQSYVVHDKYLFFFDPMQKNIYYMKIVDTGQTQPDGPVAKEVQSFFDRGIKKLKMFSCIYAGYNEIWLLINDDILIYDYNQSEWVQRVQQNINGLCLSSNRIISGGKEGKIFVEKINMDFDDKFYPSEYRTTFLNFGSNTNLKKQKTPLLIVLNDNDVNDFWVEVTINGKTKNPKRIKISNYNNGVFGDDSDPDIIPKDETWDVATFANDNPYSKIVKEISTSQTWYTMSIRVFTEELGQSFSINSIEIKNAKMKTKTRGR